MTEPFRVALTRDFLDSDGNVGWGDIGLAALDDAPDVQWEFLDSNSPEIPAGALAGYDAAIVLTPKVTARSLQGANRLRLVARFGVGYDNVDIDACTAAGVLVTITPDGVRRPVALSALTLLLALAHRVRDKDRLVRSGRWADKLDYMGSAITGRTLGLIGWGNIGRDLSQLTQPLQLRQIAFDPYADNGVADAAGVELVELEALLEQSDFVVVTAALTPETHHLLDAKRLGRMKSTAFLINVARGPIVDQVALTEILSAGTIAGAALDVFDPEPPDGSDPLLALDNVLLAPHAIAWTEELALGNGGSAIDAVLDVAAGRRPTHAINPGAEKRS